MQREILKAANNVFLWIVVLCVGKIGIEFLRYSGLFPFCLGILCLGAALILCAELLKEQWG